MKNEKELENIAKLLRIDSLKMTTSAGSGHPSSCLSCAEIIACLFFKEMKYDANDPENQENDEFILSKGHAAPILYSALYHSKCINENLLGLREITSNLEGHPMPSLKWIKIATGSLGQGLSAGVGMSLAAKLSGRRYRTYVLLGDSEMAEGSNYEAIQLASFYKLNNLVAIIDINKFGQTKETMIGHKINKYKKIFEAFGWRCFLVNGHNIEEIINALSNSKKSKEPVAILAKTIKGKGVAFMEGKKNWHGKALNKEELKIALEKIGNVKKPEFNISKPKKNNFKIRQIKIPKINFYKEKEIATREAYGRALASLVKANKNVIAIDAEVGNSTFAELAEKTAKKQFIEAYIAEQNMIGMALGLSKKGFNVFSSTFSAFLSRTHDQLRMSSLSNANFTICGSHAGVSIGEDGASQMGLEDISMFRSLPNSIIFYPSDAISTEKIVYLCAQLKGIKYIRTTRPKTKIIYSNKEEFALGDFKVLRESEKDRVVLIGSGITLHEALKANKELANSGIDTAVIDLYCIKPFNSAKFIEFVKQHGNKIVLAEDHYAEGGIGEMILNATKNSGVYVECLSVKNIPHSGKSKELLDRYKINAEAIELAARKIT